MLTSSFCCFQGISAIAERRLWDRGVLNWNDLLREGHRVLSDGRMTALRAQVAEARIALGAGLADYFIQRLPPAHRIRIGFDFWDRLMGLDIETDGLGRKAEVLTVALGDGQAIKVFVRGCDREEWLGHMPHDAILVSFNGGRFDLPLLRARFRINLGGAHLDLRDVMQAHGFRGGQKAIEKRLGIVRRLSKGMDGADVAALWTAWTENSDRVAIERLVSYNAEDVEGLFSLCRAAYRLSMAGYPLSCGLPKAVLAGPKTQWFGSLTTLPAQHIVGTAVR